MSLVTITFFFLGNVLWGLSLLSLLLTEGQVNLLIGWTGASIGVSPIAYLPVFLILALGCQIIVFYMISKLSLKKKDLAKRVKETSSENQTLSEQTKQKEKELMNQGKSLEKTQSELEKIKEKNPKEPWWKSIVPK